MKQLIVFFSGLIFFGCSSSTIITNSKYSGQDFSKKEMIIMPLADEAVDILNKDDVMMGFVGGGRTPEMIIKEEFYKSFCKDSREITGKINFFEKDLYYNLFPNQSDTLSFFTIKKQVGKEPGEVIFYIPRKETLKSKNISPDVILIINNVFFARNYSFKKKREFSNPPSGILPFPHERPIRQAPIFTSESSFVSHGSKQFITAYVEVMIYDYNQNDVISYGETTIKKEFSGNVTNSIWQSLFLDITRELYKSTPFY